jgi:hypothetical protein
MKKQNGCLDWPIVGISLLVVGIIFLIVQFMIVGEGGNQAASEQQQAQAQPVVNETMAATIRTEMESTVGTGKEREAAIIEGNPATMEIFRQTPEAATQVAVMQPTREYLREELGVEHAEGATVEEIQTMTGDLVYPTDTPTATPSPAIPTLKPFQDRNQEYQNQMRTSVILVKQHLVDYIRPTLSPRYFESLRPTIEALSVDTFPSVDYYMPVPEGYSVCYQVYPLGIPLSFGDYIPEGVSGMTVWGKEVAVSNDSHDWFHLDSLPGDDKGMTVDDYDATWFFNQTTETSRFYFCLR